MCKTYQYMLVLTLLLATVAPIFSIAYAFHLEEKAGEMKLIDIRLVEGDGPDRKIQPPTGHQFKLVSDKEDVLYEFVFSTSMEKSYAAPKDFFDEYGNQIKFVDNETHVTDEKWVGILIVPYHPNAIRADIYDDEGNLALTIDLLEYSRPGMDGNGDLVSGIGSWILLAVIMAATAAGAAAILWHSKKQEKGKKELRKRIRKRE
ncbi:MAG: hypothetical protein ABIH83_05460 [Candidatus Micrarchaeota archaeon]